MEQDEGRRGSLWLRGVMLTERPPARTDMRADVCVVGAGITGLSVAYLLAREGRDVVVLDDGPAGGGMTARTTAHLASALDDRYQTIEQHHGLHGARLAAESQSTAIARIETIAASEGIACDLARLDGYLFVPPGGDMRLLEQERDAAWRAGLTDVELVARAPLQQFDTGMALRFPRQGQLHPLRYVTGLEEAFLRHQGHLFGGVHVTDVEGGPMARAVCSSGISVTASAIVVATNSPINDRLAVHTCQAPYTTCVIAMHVTPGSVPRALYWDTEDPYHYVRLSATQEEGEVLIVGGEDFKSGQASDLEERLARLEHWARQRFPVTGVPVARWSGQVMEPVDGLAFIGKDPSGAQNVYIATGDSGQGMTHGTIAGILLTDLIQGRDNPWAPLYDPARTMRGSLREFLAGNLNVAAQYADLLLPGEARSEGSIGPGQGAVIRSGLRKLAIYRDAQGTIHRHSAVCTHLGCPVSWNPHERSWDCKCHGSKYDPYGTVINGPATSGLAPAE